MSDWPEGFVERPEPAGVTAGAEEDEPEQREAKVGGTSTPCPPGNARDHIHAQRAWVHCRGDNKKWGVVGFFFLNMSFQNPQKKWMTVNRKHKLTHPECVDSAHQLLMRCRNFVLNVLIKAWLYSQDFGQGREVIGPLWNRKHKLEAQGKQKVSSDTWWMDGCFGWQTCHFEVPIPSFLVNRSKNGNKQLRLVHLHFVSGMQSVCRH